ncbi:adenylyl-sulfate kinase [Castellaniella hirudinis]|uniref:adenylyl-sulfate kinase n=1 Tax=Castellaniella hirudinis TaxID=1144617 RepID=UPI0039C1447E
MILWLIGLSGSGKTTLGSEMARQLRARHPNTVLLDGDTLRQVFSFDQGSDPYTVEGRRINAERIASLCEMLDRQGIHVICCILSIFDDMRRANRARFSRYFEIFMDAPLEALRRRDVKGLYAAADSGQTPNVVGVHIRFEPPSHPDMVIDSSGDAPDIPSLAAQALARAGLGAST